MYDLETREIFVFRDVFIEDSFSYIKTSILTYVVSPPSSRVLVDNPIDDGSSLFRESTIKIALLDKIIALVKPISLIVACPIFLIIDPTLMDIELCKTLY